MNVVHMPVLLKEVLEFIDGERTKVIIDCTFGGGGHSKAILKEFPAVRVIGIDQDEEAIDRGRCLEEAFKGRIKLYKKNFRYFDQVLSEEGLSYVDVFLLDLGVSSYLLFDEKRGFSFMKKGPLDMRMNKDLELTAGKVINSFSMEELTNIFFQYGEERHSRKIAKAIVDYRKKKKIETTDELANIVSACIGYRSKIHPATRIFQSLRIYVNDEIGALKEFLDKSLGYLTLGGRLIIISFHSLEDRVVKSFFKDKEKEGILKILTKKPIVPRKDELKLNPRSRSAKMRVSEKVQ
jgi:16S rRNA (cytosine1402-N4)-methyltransferase